ncbi:MAG TPA: multidrug efflux SMR transporter, partial [Cyclobacteriaceae bacterium]|nr:multidrug efflux SMR transporter [Cyclobacteriaceae bacterium]
MPWIYLLIAGLFEVGFTTSLKLSKDFSVPKWTVAFYICIILSFHFLSEATKSIPLGTAYAVWTGIGAVGTAVI